LVTGRNPIWCWSSGEQRKVTGNPCRGWHDAGHLQTGQRATSSRDTELFTRMTEGNAAHHGTDL
jgi:hypothetical protein